MKPALIDFSIYVALFNSVTGMNLSNRAFLKAGERIHILERYMNVREGISHTDDTLPKRLLEQGRESDNDKKVVPLEKMLPEYYKIRGFTDHGIPLKKTLEELGIV